MLASLECMVPILASVIFTNVYNATVELAYPWSSTFYFGSASFTVVGLIFAVAVFISLKGKAVVPASALTPELSRQSSNLHPDDKLSRGTEIFCVAMRQNKVYL